VPGVGLVPFHVARVLALEVHLVLLHLGLKDILGAHAQSLGKADQEMEEVDHLNPGALLVEFLLLRPPLPRHGTNEFRHFLLHRRGVVQDPFGLPRLARGG